MEFYRFREWRQWVVKLRIETGLIISGAPLPFGDFVQNIIQPNLSIHPQFCGIFEK